MEDEHVIAASPVLADVPVSPKLRIHQGKQFYVQNGHFKAQMTFAVFKQEYIKFAGPHTTITDPSSKEWSDMLTEVADMKIALICHA